MRGSKLKLSSTKSGEFPRHLTALKPRVWDPRVTQRGPASHGMKRTQNGSSQSLARLKKTRQPAPIRSGSCQPPAGSRFPSEDGPRGICERQQKSALHRLNQALVTRSANRLCLLLAGKRITCKLATIQRSTIQQARRRPNISPLLKTFNQSASF